MTGYISKPKSLGANVKVELVDTLNCAKKTDLANLISDLDKLDIEKLKNVPSNFKSSNLKSR